MFILFSFAKLFPQNAANSNSGKNLQPYLSLWDGGKDLGEKGRHGQISFSKTRKIVRFFEDIFFL